MLFGVLALVPKKMLPGSFREIGRSFEILLHAFHNHLEASFYPTRKTFELGIDTVFGIVEPGFEAVEPGFETIESGLEAVESGLEAVESGLEAVESRFKVIAPGFHPLGQLSKLLRQHRNGHTLVRHSSIVRFAILVPARKSLNIGHTPQRRDRNFVLGPNVAVQFLRVRRPAVYVHCWGGVGRTGTIIGCWLTRNGYSGAGALERIAELRADSPDGDRQSTLAQRRLVLAFAGRVLELAAAFFLSRAAAAFIVRDAVRIV